MAAPPPRRRLELCSSLCVSDWPLTPAGRHRTKDMLRDAPIGAISYNVCSLAPHTGAYGYRPQRLLKAVMATESEALWTLISTHSSSGSLRSWVTASIEGSRIAT
jgi:hypothetical protein